MRRSYPMTERWEQKLRDLHVDPPPDMWRRVQEGPRNEPPIGAPPHRQRVVAGAVALAVFVGAAVFAWQAFQSAATTVGTSSPTPPPGMSVYTDPLGWTAFYPSDWSVTTLQQSDGLGTGVRIQNLAYLETGAFQHGVVLTVTHPLDAVPDPSAGSSPFPLAANDFKVYPGPEDLSGLGFMIEGVRYQATLHVGSAAPIADVTAMDEVIASIRPPSLTAAVSSTPAPPPPADTLDRPIIAALDYRLARVARSSTTPTWLTGTDTSLQSPYPARDVAISSDGALVAFTGFSSIEGTSYLYTGPSDGSRWTPMLSAAGGEHPSWSPDATRLTFYSGSKIYIVNADGTGLESVASGYLPTWSPDGRTIAYARLGGGGISLYDVASKTSTELTRGDDAWPAFSPDGSDVAFVRTDQSSANLLVVPARGGDLSQLTDCGPGECGDPHFGMTSLIWDPSGSSVAFVEDGEIVEVSTSGDEIARVSFNDAFGRSLGSFVWISEASQGER
jgi:hypothetical protein